MARGPTLTPDEVVASAGPANGWARNTVRVLVTRLLKKGAISGARAEDGRYLYRPLLARADYVTAESQGLLDRLFQGEVAPLVAHFAQHRDLDPGRHRKAERLDHGDRQWPPVKSCEISAACEPGGGGGDPAGSGLAHGRPRPVRRTTELCSVAAAGAGGRGGAGAASPGGGSSSPGGHCPAPGHRGFAAPAGDGGEAGGGAHRGLPFHLPRSPPPWLPKLNPTVLILWLWLTGVVCAGLTMVYLQRRFIAEALKGAVGPAVVGVIAPRIVKPRDFRSEIQRRRTGARGWLTKKPTSPARILG